jgi:hypothetical protein
MTRIVTRVNMWGESADPVDDEDVEVEVGATSWNESPARRHDPLMAKPLPVELHS